MTTSHEVHRPSGLVRWIAAAWASLRQSSDAFVRMAYDKPWLKDSVR
ncbi:MAG TPA: hypothetical protein VEA44_11020 [Caulobacter sp.]|nr:hypothetical protein [Caulobacter sp.]